MRSFITRFAALLILTLTTRAFAQSTDRASAQYTGVDPRTLPAEIAAQQRIVESAPGSADWHAWLKLAVLLQDSALYAPSEAAYRRTIALLRAPDPLTVADVFDHMGTLYIETGQLAEADPLLRHALAIREHQHDALGLGVSHMHLAMLLLKENALPSAAAEATTAVALLVPEYTHLAAVSSASPEEKMTALIDLSLIESASAANPNALPPLRAALEIARSTYPDNSLPVGYIEFLLGYTDWKTPASINSRNTEADAALMQTGVRKLATTLGWGHPTYLTTLRQYRTFLTETNQPAKALEVTAELQQLERSGHSLSASAANIAALHDPSTP